MSLFNDDSSSIGGGLYDSVGTDPVSPKSNVTPIRQPDTQQAAAASSEPDAASGAKAALEIIANPTSLLSDVLPADASQSKLPYGLAVLGLCGLAIWWANWVDEKVGK